METPDKKIVQMCKQYKKEGYDLLFQKYEKFIYKICYHYTVSREDALDLLQEVYIKIYRNMDTFNENQPVPPWIKRIAVNTCLNFVRDRKEKVTSLNSIVDDNENTIEDLVASSSNVEQEVSCIDTKKALENAIRSLPDEMRAVVILRHIDGMSYDEISRAMACPIGTVKTYLFRGRKILKDKLLTEGLLEV